MSSIRVSVVVPTYNSAKTIGATLDSCLAQTHQPLEIIVVDDGSNDDTVAIVQDYIAHYQGIQLIQQVNSGPSIARNQGIQASTSDYIQFCDSDDQLLPEKIALSLARLQDARTKNPQIVLAYCRMRHVNADGISPLEREPSSLLPHTHTFCEILQSNGSPIQTSTLLVRKDALIEVGAYRADRQRCAEDWDMLLRLAQRYEFVGHDDVLVLYRHTPEALTTKPIEMAQGRLQTVEYAGTYEARRACMNDNAFANLLAGRHHVLAMAYWRQNERSQARHHFRQALQISKEGRLMRRLLAILTYFAPASIVD